MRLNLLVGGAVVALVAACGGDADNPPPPPPPEPSIRLNLEVENRAREARRCVLAVGNGASVNVVFDASVAPAGVGEAPLAKGSEEWFAADVSASCYAAGAAAPLATYSAFVYVEAPTACRFAYVEPEPPGTPYFEAACRR